MNKEMLTAIEDFSKELKGALAQMESSDKEVKQLATQIDGIESKLLDIAVKAQFSGGSKPKYLGEWDSEKHAESFIEYCADVLHPMGAKAPDGLQTGVDADGGYLVPPDFVPVLIRLIESYGIGRQNVTVLPMNTNEKTFPSLSSGINVYWIDEGGAITEVKPQFGQVKMTTKKLACLIPATSEVLEDSSIALANLFATLVAESMAEEEDRVIFTGDTGNNDPFMGVINEVGVNVVTLADASTLYTDLTSDKVLDMQNAVKRSAQKGAKYWIHRTVFDVIRKLKDKNENYIWAPPTTGGPGTIWGFPFELVEAMPSVTGTGASDQAGTPFLIFGNLKHVYLGDRKKLTAANSQHVGFKTDQTFFRFLLRESIKCAIPSAFSVLKTAAA